MSVHNNVTYTRMFPLSVSNYLSTMLERERERERETV